MTKRVVITMLVFLLVNCENASEEFLIKEGYGVNIFKLGVNISESPKEIDGIKLMVNRDSLIHAIDINSSLYYTKDSIKVGQYYKTIIQQRGMYDTRKDIEKANPTNRKQTKIPSSMPYEGVIFFIDDKGIVERIRIY